MSFHFSWNADWTAHEHQLINYLKSTDCEVGLLLNFGKRPRFVRKVFNNYKK